MLIPEKIKKTCYAIATLGSLGEWWLGGVFASMLAIPLLFLYRSVYWLSNTLFYWFIVISAVFFIVVIQIALQFPRGTPTSSRSPIVLDKIIGVMIALISIRLRWRVVIFGFVLFHLLNTFFILFHLLNTLKPFWWCRKIIERIERSPGVIGILGTEVLSGALINVFLHLITWVMLG